MITGASAGIGKATAWSSPRAARTLVLACRDLDKAAGARAEILARTPGARVDARCRSSSEPALGARLRGEARARTTRASTC